MFRTMVEASPDIIWEIDTKGNFTYISPQCKVQLGYEPGDLIGQSFFSLIRPESVSLSGPLSLNISRRKVLFPRSKSLHMTRRATRSSLRSVPPL